MLMNESMTTKPGSVQADRRLGPEETDREIRRVYTACLLYGISEMLFANSFMLLYLAKLGVPSERILLYLAIPIFVSLFALVPFAQWTDRLGKVFTGVLGLSLATLALVDRIGTRYVFMSCHFSFALILVAFLLRTLLPLPLLYRDFILPGA